MGGSGVSGLAAKHCVPCRGGVPPLAGEELRSYRRRFRIGKLCDNITSPDVCLPDF